MKYKIGDIVKYKSPNKAPELNTYVVLATKETPLTSTILHKLKIANLKLGEKEIHVIEGFHYRIVPYNNGDVVLDEELRNVFENDLHR